VQRYQIDVTLTFDIGNAEALRLAAWEIEADRREIEREGKDIYADRATATSEAALSVLIGRSEGLRDALRTLAASVNGMTYMGQFTSPASVCRVIDDE